jgi:hypothetical protein
LDRPIAPGRFILTPPNGESRSILDRLLRFHGVILDTLFILNRGTILDRGFITDSPFSMNSRARIDSQFKMNRVVIMDSEFILDPKPFWSEGLL